MLAKRTYRYGNIGMKKIRPVKNPKWPTETFYPGKKIVMLSKIAQSFNSRVHSAKTKT